MASASSIGIAGPTLYWLMRSAWIHASDSPSSNGLISEALRTTFTTLSSFSAHSSGVEINERLPSTRFARRLTADSTARLSSTLFVSPALTLIRFLLHFGTQYAQAHAASSGYKQACFPKFLRKTQASRVAPHLEFFGPSNTKLWRSLCLPN